MTSVNNSSTDFLKSRGTNSSLYFKSGELATIERIDIILPSLVILVIASVIGTLGNILILTSVFTSKSLRKVEGIFIVNLAMSDLYVTVVADPMSIIAKVKGEEFLSRLPGLCQTIAIICTISCVTSLMTIAAMSFNRYIYICQHVKYDQIFTKWNTICICTSFYFIGGIIVLLNVADIGDHGFDSKSLECIWDRMATYPYTIFFSITLVWIPSIVTGFCYVKIFLYVRNHKKRIREQSNGILTRLFKRNFHLARTLFIIYAVFITCWAPYALLIVIDSKDTYPHQVHLYITMFAHLHPSLNWLVYLVSNKKFADAYKNLLNKCGLCHFDIVETNCSNASQIPSASTPNLKQLNHGNNQGLNIVHDKRLRSLQLLFLTDKSARLQDINRNFKSSSNIAPESTC